VCEGMVGLWITYKFGVLTPVKFVPSLPYPTLVWVMWLPSVTKRVASAPPVIRRFTSVDEDVIHRTFQCNSPSTIAIL